MNETSKKDQKPGIKSGQKFGYRKTGNIRVLHKAQVPTHTVTTQPKQNNYADNKIHYIKKNKSW